VQIYLKKRKFRIELYSACWNGNAGLFIDTYLGDFVHVVTYN